MADDHAERSEVNELKGTGRHHHTSSIAAGAACIAALLMSLFSACTIATIPEEEPALRAVTTIPPLADFLEHVGGGLVQVTIMVPAGASPHTYEPTPGQMSEVAHADVYFKVGSGVEFELVWLDKLIAQNPEMPVVDCSRGIELIDDDPHIWNSPLNAITMVHNIIEGLASVDPDNTDTYAKNGAAYVDELRALHSEIKQMFEGADSRYFLVYHPSFAYFADEYDLIQLAIEEEGKATTPQTLQRTIDTARKHGLRYVFVEPQFATAEAEGIAETLGAEVVAIDPLPRIYIPAMRSTAEAIARELKQE